VSGITKVTQAQMQPSVKDNGNNTLNKRGVKDLKKGKGTRKYPVIKGVFKDIFRF